jgi:predicted phosphodiesterase
LRIAVLSDIHAMADALDMALAAARREGFDRLLILGDLLTYGVAPERTLALVADSVERDGAILIAGNHDQMYLDLAEGPNAYFQRLPDWLRETVEWTARRVSIEVLEDFAWQREWACGPLLTAHANPFPFGDWSYIATEAQAQAAADALSARGFAYGLFGHVHRHRTFSFGGVRVFTVGSLGQPRDAADPALQWAMIHLEDDIVTVTPKSVAFDRQSHIAAIRATSLSAPTQDRLCEFFV